MPTNKDNTVLEHPTHCQKCDNVLPTTGYFRYAIHDTFGYICIPCASTLETEWLKDHDKATLYYDDRKNIITNFSGLLVIQPKYHTVTKHNWYCVRKVHNVWFIDPYGNKWYGRQMGDNNQLLHCRKVKHF